MGFNVISFLENLFGIGKPSTVATPSQFQGAIYTAGGVMDQFEAGITTLQSAAQFLPPAFQGYVAAIAVAVHAADGFLDTFETQAAAAPSGPSTDAQTTPSPTPTPTPSQH